MAYAVEDENRLINFYVPILQLESMLKTAQKCAICVGNRKHKTYLKVSFKRIYLLIFLNVI